MKKFIIITLLIQLICLTNLSANKLNEAEQLFQSQNYTKALEIYHKLLDSVPRNPELLYNIGSTYAKNEQYGYARYYFTQALILDPRDSSLKENIKFVEKKLIDQEYLKRSLLNVITNSFNQALSLNEAWLIWIILFSVFNIMIWIKKSTSNQKLVRLYKIIGIFLCFSSLILLLKIYQINFNHKGMIVQSKSSIHSGPSNQLPTLFFIHEGTDFLIINNKNNWSKIKLSSGRKGWIQQSDFKKL